MSSALLSKALNLSLSPQIGYCYMMLLELIGIENISYMLGHSDISITTKVYSKPGKESVGRAMLMIEKI